MAYRVRLEVNFDWIPDGGGTTFLGINQANDPGYAANLAAGAVGMAQTATLMISELVPGADAPTLANFLTALTNAANDLAGTPPLGGTPIMSQPGAMFGQSGTPLAIVQAWATGNP